MAPPRARMTNDRSTGIAVKVKLAGIGTGRRLLGNKPLDKFVQIYYLHVITFKYHKYHPKQPEWSNSFDKYEFSNQNMKVSWSNLNRLQNY